MCEWGACSSKVSHKEQTVVFTFNISDNAVARTGASKFGQTAGAALNIDGMECNEVLPGPIGGHPSLHDER